MPGSGRSTSASEAQHSLDGVSQPLQTDLDAFLDSTQGLLQGNIFTAPGAAKGLPALIQLDQSCIALVKDNRSGS